MKPYMKLLLLSTGVCWILLYLVYRWIKSQPAMTGIESMIYCMFPMLAWAGIICVFGVVLPARRMKKQRTYDTSELEI